MLERVGFTVGEIFLPYRKAEAASYFLPLIFVAFYSINFESLPIAVPKERILRCRILSFGGAGGIRTHVPELPTN